MLVSVWPSLLGSLLLSLLFFVIGHPFRSHTRYTEKPYFESLTSQEPPE